MSQILAYVLLIPLMLWSTFQGLLYWNATTVEEALNLSLYKGLKEASLQGHFDQNIYNDMESYLVNVYHYDQTKIQITGTQTVKSRGEYITASITIPRPMMNVLSIFSFSTTPSMTVTKSIMSEYVP